MRIDRRAFLLSNGSRRPRSAAAWAWGPPPLLSGCSGYGAEPHAKQKEFIMADRFPVSKFSSARSFERSAGHTRAINYITPMRGGWRL